MHYTVTEAREKLPDLIKQAEDGDNVTITRRGIAVVQIVRMKDIPKPGKRVFGGFDDDVEIYNPDWARPQNDIDAWLSGDV